MTTVCRNCVVTMTSKIGADILVHMDRGIPAQTKQMIMDLLKAQLPVSLLNRIDDVVMFVST